MQIKTWNASDDAYNIRTDIIDMSDVESRVLIKALEYYTDKRKIEFSERMRAGDMARAIRESKINAINEASAYVLSNSLSKMRKGQNNG